VLFYAVWFQGHLIFPTGGVAVVRVKVYHNGDDVFIAWKPDGFIPQCRGFALLRRRNGVEEIVSTWVGFEDDQALEGRTARIDQLANPKVSVD
jgi:hypothetical protein